MTRLAILIGRQKWLPRFAAYIVAVDRFLQKVTGHRVTLAGIAGLPELMLTVTGRKSGLPRTTPLIYVSYEGDYLVAGSNWGGPTRPAWVLNLIANPDATVRIRGRTVSVHARVAEGTERTRMWQAMLDVWPNYATYQARTGRQLPVLVLTRRNSPDTPRTVQQG